jgi:hypothetical protein
VKARRFAGLSCRFLRSGPFMRPAPFFMADVTFAFIKIIFIY